MDNEELLDKVLGRSKESMAFRKEMEQRNQAILDRFNDGIKKYDAKCEREKQDDKTIEKYSNKMLSGNKAKKEKNYEDYAESAKVISLSVYFNLLRGLTDDEILYEANVCRVNPTDGMIHRKQAAQILAEGRGFIYNESKKQFELPPK